MWMEFSVARQIGEGAYTLNGAGHLTLGTEDLPPGNNYGNNGYITATIYDVRIYNYALPQSVIATNIPPKVPVFTGGAGAVAVTTGPNGPQFVLTYATGTLQSSTNVAGPWAPVAGATSPYTNLLDSATPNEFFRLSNP